MKKTMKYLFTFLVALTLVFALAACGDKDQTTVDAAVEDLEIQYTAPDTKDSVTKDLILPTTVGEVKVEWTSDKTDVIKNDGKVVRPASDTVVNLTANLSLNSAKGEKKFAVNVTAAMDYASVLARVELGGIEKEGDLYVTDKDFSIPTTQDGVTLTWVSADPTTISNDGKVTQPLFGQSDKVVTLTVSAGGEERQILVKVIAVKVEPLIDILNQAKDALLLPGIGNGVADDITLPSEVGQKGVTVTWKSGNTDILSDDGVVVRGKDNATTKITATFHLDGYTGEPVTKDFDIIILALAEFIQLEELHDIQDLENVPNNSYVKADDVTVLGTTDDGYMISDGSLVVFVYDDGIRKPHIKTGAVINIIGETNFYYGAPQIQYSDSSAKPIITNLSNGDVTEIEPKPVDNIHDYLFEKGDSFGMDNFFEFEYIRLTAYVRYYSDDNYQTVFVDDKDYQLKTAANSEFDIGGVVVYYKSNNKSIQAYDGFKVTVDVFLYSLRTDRKVFTVIFTGDTEDIVFSGTDEEKLAIIEETARGQIKERYVDNTTIKLPTEILRETITWTSSDVNAIDPATGKVVLPATGESVVKLTASITLGGVEKTFEVEVKLGLPEVDDIKDVKESKIMIRVEGILTGPSTNNTYYIQDESGAISVYVSGVSEELATALKNAVGKKVDLVGDIGSFGGLYQILPVKVVSTSDAEALPVQSLDELELNETALEPHQSKLVSISNVVITKHSVDSYGNITFTLVRLSDGETIDFQWDSRVTIPSELETTLKGLQNGQMFDVSHAILSWNSNKPRLAPTSALTFVVPQDISEEQKIEMATIHINSLIASEYRTAATVTLPTLFEGVNIAWTSSHPEYFDVVTGKVVLPQDDLVEVSLTAVLTIGDKTEELTIKTEVGVMPVTNSVDAKKLAKGDIVKVSGVLLGNGSNGGWFIQDETGGIALYDFNNASKLSGAIGKQVTVVGAIDIYNELVQVRDLVASEIVIGDKVDMPTAVLLNTGELDKATLLEHQSKLVTLNSATIKDYDKENNITFTAEREDGKTISFRYDSRVTLQATLLNRLKSLKNGDVVDLDGFVLGWFNGPQLLIVDGSAIIDVELTDAQKVASDKESLTLATTLFPTAGTLVLPTAGALGSVITWDYHVDATEQAKELLNLTTGVVTLPASGLVELKIVATLEIESETATKEFTLYIGVNEVNTIAEAKLKENEAPVIISGILLEGDARDVFYVHDATGAMPLVTQQAAQQATLKGLFGKQVEINGVINQGDSTGSFTFLHIKEFTVTDQGEATDVPLKVTLPNVEEATLKEHLGKMVSYSNLTVESLSSNKTTIYFVDTTLTIYIRNTLIDPGAAALVMGLQVGDIISIVDVVLGEGYGTPRLHVNAVSQVVKSELTDQQKVDSDLNSLVGTIAILEAGSIALPAVGDNGTTITWSFKDSEDTNNALINLTDKTVTMPTESLEVTLVALVKLGEIEATKDVSVSFTVGGVLTISAAKDLAVGTVVKVEGILTSYANNNYPFLQDSTGAIALDIYSLTEEKKASLLAAVGKSVTITGEKADNKGLIEIEKITEFIIGEVATLPSPLSLDEITKLDSTSLLPHQSKLVSINEVTVTEINIDTYGTVTFKAVRTDGEKINFRWDNRIPLSTELKATLDGLVNNKVINLTNLVLGWYDVPQVMLFAGSSITELAISDEQKAAIAQAELVLPASGNVTSNISLPITGLYGAVITWTASSEQSAITINGAVAEVTRQATNVEVTLSYSLVVGSSTPLTGTVDVIVVAEGEVVPETTVEAVFTDHRTNVPAGDITSMFGLGGEIFAIHQVNNEANNNMWMTANEIRLYSVGATGEGTELVFGIAAGYKILAIEFTVLANYRPNAQIFVDGVSNQVYSGYGTVILVEDLSASVVSIKNVHEGGSNTQLRISGIKITYVAV